MHLNIYWARRKCSYNQLQTSYFDIHNIVLRKCSQRTSNTIEIQSPTRTFHKCTDSRYKKYNNVKKEYSRRKRCKIFAKFLISVPEQKPIYLLYAREHSALFPAINMCTYTAYILDTRVRFNQLSSSNVSMCVCLTNIVILRITRAQQSRSGQSIPFYVLTWYTSIQ